ncbi:MAG: hypothetical protein I8H77_13510 [Comamonadaceae bacterium]|nr:hypothetical protein [Comamonadaceae bacterium]
MPPIDPFNGSMPVSEQSKLLAQSDNVDSLPAVGINEGESLAPSLSPVDDMSSELEEIRRNFEIMRKVKIISSNENIVSQFSEEDLDEIGKQLRRLDNSEEVKQAVILNKIAIKRYKKSFASRDDIFRIGCVFTKAELEKLRQCQIGLLKDKESLEGLFRIYSNSSQAKSTSSSNLDTVLQIDIKNDLSDLNERLEWELEPYSTGNPLTLLQSHIKFWVEYCGKDGGPTVPIIVLDDLEQGLPLTELREVQEAIWRHESDRGFRERWAFENLHSFSAPEWERDEEHDAG